MSETLSLQNPYEFSALIVYSPSSSKLTELIINEQLFSDSFFGYFVVSDISNIIPFFSQVISDFEFFGDQTLQKNVIFCFIVQIELIGRTINFGIKFLQFKFELNT